MIFSHRLWVNKNGEKWLWQNSDRHETEEEKTKKNIKWQEIEIVDSINGEWVRESKTKSCLFTRQNFSSWLFLVKIFDNFLTFICVYDLILCGVRERRQKKDEKVVETSNSRHITSLSIKYRDNVCQLTAIFPSFPFSRFVCFFEVNKNPKQLLPQRPFFLLEKSHLQFECAAYLGSAEWFYAAMSKQIIKSFKILIWRKILLVDVNFATCKRKPSDSIPANFSSSYFLWFV